MKTRSMLSLLIALALLMACVPALATIEIQGDPRIAQEGEDITFTVFQALTSTVEDLSYEKNQATRIITDATGIKLEFIAAPAADKLTKLNLLLNSGDYPDIISARATLSRAEMAMYADQGIFVDMSEYITPELAPNTYEIFASNAAAKLVCTGTDGGIYSLPDINECYHCLHGNGRAWYYMPWMAKYEAGVPTTTDELEAYLKWILETDVNGNGDATDEVPLAFPKDNNNRFIIWISNFFQPYTSDHYRVEADGTISALFVNEEYKQTLEYANKLYSEGLILEDCFSVATEDLRTVGEDPNGARLGVIVGWGPEDGVAKAGSTLRWYEYGLLSPVEGPTGARYAVYSGDWGSVSNGWFVTDSCENVEYATRLGDLLLDEYFGYTTYIGPKGVSWDDPNEGALGFNGQPALFRELVAYGTQETNCSWDQSNITNRYVDFRMSQEAEGVDLIHQYLDGDFSLKEEVAKLGSYNEVMKYYECEQNLHPYIIDESTIVPSLLYADDVADQVADATALVDAYRTEMLAAFVTGTRSLDEYDQYVQEMNDMGLGIILDAKNAAYQEYLATK
ncbi:MAG: hypothetical protein ACI4L8_11655 [Candidatus Fimadaptatus sp.]